MTFRHNHGIDIDSDSDWDLNIDEKSAYLSNTVDTLTAFAGLAKIRLHRLIPLETSALMLYTEYAVPDDESLQSGAHINRSFTNDA